jgi:hypothetical protein
MTDDGNRLSSAGRRLSSEGAIAQLGERLLCKQEVVGSIPTGSTSRVIRPQKTCRSQRRNAFRARARSGGFQTRRNDRDRRAVSEIVKR